MNLEQQVRMGRVFLFKWFSLHFVVCFALANGEEIEVLQNEAYQKGGREDLIIAQLLPARETLEYEGERAVTSSGDNSDLPRGMSVGVCKESKINDPLLPIYVWEGSGWWSWVGMS